MTGSPQFSMPLRIALYGWQLPQKDDGTER